MNRQSRQVDLATAIANIKSNPIMPKESDLLRCKGLLLKECNLLIKVLDADSDRESAKVWRTELKLDSIKAILSEEGLPEIDAIKDAWSDFNQDKKGLRWEIFNGVRNELRRYLMIHTLLNSSKPYDEHLIKACDDFETMFQDYIKTSSSITGSNLNDFITWFNDISLFDSRASQVVAAVRKRTSEPNIQFTVNDRFMSNGFSRELSRDIDVNETIQGTKLIGSGSMTGLSSSAIVRRSKGAAIDVIIDANMETETTGYHSPVTLNTRTTGTLWGKKRVLLSPDRITALPAASKAELDADIYNVRVKAGKLVTCIAKCQVESQREDSLAEATVRAEKKLNDQIDAIVDAEIADANEQYQSSFRRPLKKFGLLPEFSISSFPSDSVKDISGRIEGRALVGSSFQPGGIADAPMISNEYDVFVQVHQSLPNNVASFALSGRNFDETESNLGEQLGEFEALRQILERKQEQDPIAITFAGKSPFVVEFEEDIVRVIIRIDRFVRNGSRYPGLDITLVYKVKTERTESGEFVVVFEQLEKPDAMPRGKTSVSAREQTIRTVVMRRLESAPKRIELKPFGLKWKGWKDAGELKPVFAKSTSGWLTIGFNWIKTAKENKVASK
ncbi:MAG: hypothetical protein LBB88_11690 [Planctomycetaceae bacterium]|nr:hypothetical protein [Planctomycetaceae bacterium]